MKGVIKVKMSLDDLIRSIARAGHQRLRIMRYGSKSFVLSDVADEVLVLYSDEAPNSKYAKYNPTTDEVTYTDKLGREPDMAYITFQEVFDLKGVKL